MMTGLSSCVLLNLAGRISSVNETSIWSRRDKADSGVDDGS
jgi:hypothetical protein